jgi:peptidoglycan/xylan/chitin deacetylase (PgdA/CDA1 family)
MRKLSTFWFIIALVVLIVSAIPNISAEDSSPTIMGDGTLRRIRVPILMYHYISTPPPNADVYRINLSLDPAIFEQHLAYLRAENYSTISLQNLHDALMMGAPLPPKSVILTFDDGYLDHYTHAFPLLQAAGYTGTFFIITGFADTLAAGHLNWEHIKTMAEAGMQMESHTKTHPDLRGRTYEFLVHEFLGSIESLNFHNNQQTRFLCFPGGKYDAYTLDILRTTDILRAVTTTPGTLHTTDNYYEMPRLRITNETGVAGLVYLLNSF